MKAAWVNALLQRQKKLTPLKKLLLGDERGGARRVTREQRAAEWNALRKLG